MKYLELLNVANVICDLYFKNKKISEKYSWKTRKYVFVKKIIYEARESFKTRHNIYEACAKQDEWL